MATHDILIGGDGQDWIAKGTLDTKLTGDAHPIHLMCTPTDKSWEEAVKNAVECGVIDDDNGGKSIGVGSM
jgi:hypothetical protein